MNRRWLLSTLAAGALAATGLVLIVQTPRFQKWYNPPVLILPADDEVAEMRASLREFQGAFGAVPEFIVPAEHVPRILSWLRPAEYVREPWQLVRADELGEVIIRTTAEREVRLRFYWTGKNPAVLTADEVDQFYGRGRSDDGRPIDGGMQLRFAIEKASGESR